MVDLAVGIVIGAAFGKIVASFVSDILMPLVGAVLGGMDFSSLSLTLKKAAVENGEVVREAVSLNYGNFIQSVVDFAIIAFAIFLVVKGMNSLRKKEEGKPKEKSEQVKLLMQIRDELKNRKQQ